MDSSQRNGHSPKSNEILLGDALTVLRTLPSESVQCIVTSPPYWNLRDYGVAGQIGLEKSPAVYIAKLVEIFREAQRVLRRDGTCWVNIGDTYAGGSRGRDDSGDNGKFAGPRIERKDNATPAGFKPKDLMMIPARLAIALCDDGWYLRSEIIWHKPSAMPESVQDRPTKAHEHIYLLAKSEQYYYDNDAIRERTSDIGFTKKAATRLPSFVGNHGTRGHDGNGMRMETVYNNPLGRNKRDVWTVASAGYPDAHFATFPVKLIEPCILAGTSPRACEQCGAPWQRQTERTPMIVRNGPKSGHYGSRTTDSLSGTMLAPAETRTIGWQPTCTCEGNTGVGKCVVLDPFCGAGTTPLVALKHNRAYLGIELNPEYVRLAKKRISLGPLWEEIEVAS